MLSLRAKPKGDTIYAVGTVAMFMTKQPPPGWFELVDDQHYLDPTTYSALFAVVGYKFGKNAQGHFRLPGYRSGSYDARFIKIVDRESNGFVISFSETPLHDHSVYCDSDGNHGHSFPNGDYLRNDTVMSGAPNANGSGTSYRGHSSTSHTWHSHGGCSSGDMTDISTANISAGSYSAPESITGRVAIYTGV